MTGKTQRRKQSRPPRAGRSHYVTYNGRKMLLVEVAAKVGMHRKTLVSRLARNGGNLERALAEPIKKRATVDEFAARHAAIYEIVEAGQPMMARAVFYQMEVHHPDMIAKDSNGYKMVVSDLGKMRESGRMPFEWIIDESRTAIRPYAFRSIKDALLQTADNFRSDLWVNMDCLVQVWLEKISLAEVIQDMTLSYGVPLMPCRGYNGKSAMHKEAKKLWGETRPVFCYLLGDYDPSGVNAHETIESTMRRYAPDVDFRFTRLAITPKQIKQWHLPKRLTKEDDSRTRNWEGGSGETSVELDSIEPTKLRKLVEDAINKHMTADERDELSEDDEDARNYICKLAESAP